MTGTTRGTVAVIGSGIAGLTAAYLLQRHYDVTLIEADDRLGGHADTHDVLTPDGRWINVDTGFIVHNRSTYPNLVRLFGELDVPTRATEMSMSISCPDCGLEYAGARGLGGVFAQPRRVVDRRYLSLLAQVHRFYGDARRMLRAEEADVDSLSLAGFAALHGYSDYFVTHFLLPIVSAVWSTGAAMAMQYPARYLFEFLEHHQMLRVSGSPTWRTVVGGSRTYVERVVKNLSAVHTSTPVRAVTRHADGVEIRDSGDRIFHADHVVLSTHPGQALAMLTDATPDEQTLLSAMPYSRNTALLHTDLTLLPKAPRARSSWNYTVPDCAARPDEAVGVSYWMNRLQGLDEPTDYVVSLNCADRVDPATVIARRNYEHPIYNSSSLAAQRLLPALNTGRTCYAGAYHGWGFHEDGCASGVAAAASLGVDWS
ncbi:MAG: FAD-dependent oxidoreductase [Nakamurella sp.]